MTRYKLPVLGALLLASSSFASAQSGTSLRDQLKIDQNELDRTDRRSGYATVVEQVSPSVVSISTSSKVSAPGRSLYRDLFDDPFFRYFFDNPFDRNKDRERPEALPERESPPQIRRGLGSGVILTSDGYIATNNHVIEGADKIEVTLPGESREYEAKVIGSDRGTDLALLKIDADKLPIPTLGDSSRVKVGDTALAIGNPFGLSQTVTSGIVSGLGRNNLSIAGYENFIQTDASINPGNSGGALIDSKGRVIGINTAIISRAGGNVGIGFAIPSNMAVEILDRLLVFGEVQRGYLGVMLSDLTPELAEGFGVELKGVLVNDVMEDTPAEKGGIESGDIITSYNGEAAGKMADLRLRVANTKPGTRVGIEVIRKGKNKKLTIEIGRLPADAESPSDFEPVPPSSTESFLPGVDITSLDSEKRKMYRIPDDTEGVLVSRVEPNSPVYLAGLRQGDVILSVARKPVSSVKEAIEARKNARGRMILLRVMNRRGTRFIAVDKGK